MNQTPEKKFWPLYKAIHQYRFSKNAVYTDPDTGKQYTLHYIGMEEIRQSPILLSFNGFLWMCPAFFAIFIAVLLGTFYPITYLWAIVFVIAYHFAGMYYIIKGPMLELVPVKKSLFSRK